MTAAGPNQLPDHEILLVDENSHGMVARRRVLLDLGYRVETACCAKEALEIISKRERMFDVVVTDYRMSFMNGVDLIARVKTASPQTRTILLSGMIESWGLTEETTGADAVIAKSATEVGQLTRTLEGFFAKRARRKAVASQKRAPKSAAANSSVVKNA